MTTNTLTKHVTVEDLEGLNALPEGTLVTELDDDYGWTFEIVGEGLMRRVAAGGYMNTVSTEVFILPALIENPENLGRELAFSVGDRVRLAVNLSLYSYGEGTEATIAQVRPEDSGFDYLVQRDQLDTDFAEPIRVKVYEREIEAITAPAPEVGDIVEITGPPTMSDWFGIRAEVSKAPSNHWSDSLWLTPLSDRPDGFGRAGCWWSKDEVKVVQLAEEVEAAEEAAKQAEIEETLAMLDALRPNSAVSMETGPLSGLRLPVVKLSDGTWARFNVYADADDRLTTTVDLERRVRAGREVKVLHAA